MATKMNQPFVCKNPSCYYLDPPDEFISCLCHNALCQNFNKQSYVLKQFIKDPSRYICYRCSQGYNDLTIEAFLLLSPNAQATFRLRMVQNNVHLIYGVPEKEHLDVHPVCMSCCQGKSDMPFILFETLSIEDQLTYLKQTQEPNTAGRGEAPALHFVYDSEGWDDFEEIYDDHVAMISDQGQLQEIQEQDEKEDDEHWEYTNFMHDQANYWECMIGEKEFEDVFICDEGAPEIKLSAKEVEIFLAGLEDQQQGNDLIEQDAVAVLPALPDAEVVEQQMVEQRVVEPEAVPVAEVGNQWMDELLAQRVVMLNAGVGNRQRVEPVPALPVLPFVPNAGVVNRQRGPQGVAMLGAGVVNRQREQRVEPLALPVLPDAGVVNQQREEREGPQGVVMLGAGVVNQQREEPHQMVQFEVRMVERDEDQPDQRVRQPGQQIDPLQRIFGLHYEYNYVLQNYSAEEAEDMIGVREELEEELEELLDMYEVYEEALEAEKAQETEKAENNH